MEVNFGARVDKSLLNLIHSANKATKNNAFKRRKLMKGLERIKNAPFEKISYKPNDDVARFELSSKYSIYQMVQDPKTKQYVNKTTIHQQLQNFDTTIPNDETAPTTILNKLSKYLSFWDKENSLW